MDTPKPPKDPKKVKWVYIISASLICIFFLGTIGVSSYLLYKLNKENNSLKSDKATLEQQVEEYKSSSSKESEEYEKQIAELEAAAVLLNEQITTLTSEKDSLNIEVDDYEKKQTNIKAYNDFNKYVYYVVGIHGGFINLTEAEYQTARSKAVATGNQTLVDAVDTAWTDTGTSQIIRFVNVMNAAIDGINANL